MHAVILLCTVVGVSLSLIRHIHNRSSDHRGVLSIGLLPAVMCSKITHTSNSFFTYVLALYVDGLSLLNEDGGLRVFFPRNSFVTNTTLTHTNSPRMQSASSVPRGDDHIVCYGGDPQAKQVTWRNSSGEQLQECRNDVEPTPCLDCGPRCQANGAVGQDDPVNGHTDIHMYTDSTAYVNQDLECRVSGGQSAFIGVYLENGGEMVSLHTSG